MKTEVAGLIPDFEEIRKRLQIKAEGQLQNVGRRMTPPSLLSKCPAWSARTYRFTAAWTGRRGDCSMQPLCASEWSPLILPSLTKSSTPHSKLNIRGKFVNLKNFKFGISFRFVDFCRIFVLNDAHHLSEGLVAECQEVGSQSDLRHGNLPNLYPGI